MSNLIKARRGVLDLGQVQIDCYELPSGEKRIGIGGAAKALGYAKNWINRLPSNSPKKLKSLQGQGFTGYLKDVSVSGRGDSTRGSSISQTISIRDFTKLCVYEAISSSNKSAIVLLAAFAEEGLQSVVDRLFKNQDVEDIKSRIVHYSQWTYEELEEVLAYNRSELKSLYVS